MSGKGISSRTAWWPSGTARAWKRPTANAGLTRSFTCGRQPELEALFQECPEALANTLEIAERCTLDLTKDLDYTFPDYPAPEGYTPDSYLEKLCYEAAVRRYGSVTPAVQREAGPGVPSDPQIQPGRLPADVP